jgi:hypothetical protein
VRPASGGGSVLWATAAPGVTSATLTGLTNGANYKVKVRHVKSRVGSDYTGEIDAYTLLPAPVLTWVSFYSTLHSAVSIDHGAVKFEANTVEYNSLPVTYVGDYTSSPNGPGTKAYRSRCYDSAWPAAIQYSQYSGTLVITT